MKMCRHAYAAHRLLCFRAGVGWQAYKPDATLQAVIYHAVCVVGLVYIWQGCQELHRSAQPTSTSDTTWGPTRIQEPPGTLDAVDKVTHSSTIYSVVIQL